MELTSSLSLINIIMLAVAILLLCINVFGSSITFVKFRNYSVKLNFILLLFALSTLFIFYGSSILVNIALAVTVLLYLLIIVFIPRYYFYGAALFLLLLSIPFTILALGVLAEFCGNFAFILLASGFIHDFVWPFITEKKECPDES